MERGYVKLWRKSLDSGLIENPNAWQLFGYLLMEATHKHKKFSSNGVLVELHPGDAIFGRKAVSEKLKMSEQSVRTALDFLKKLEIVTSRSTNRFTVISFVNWDRYQGLEDCNQPTDQPTGNQQVTNSQPTGNQQVTTTQECKNVRMKECKNENIKSPSVPQGEVVEKKTKRESTGDSKAELHAQIDDYTENEDLRQALKNWVVMRVKAHKPLTGYALKRNLGELNKLSDSVVEKIQIVDQTIMKSWQGFYPLKDSQPSLLPLVNAQSRDPNRCVALPMPPGWKR